MIAVNVLVQRVYKALNMTGQGESTDGDMAVVAVEELNRLITTLNSQGFISMSQKFLDVPACSSVIFKKFRPDETVPANAIDMEPPEKVDAVSRKMGVRFVPLDSLDEVQMSSRNPHAMATSWNYGRDFETVDGGMREVGLVRFDGRNPYGVRVFYSSKLPNYDISSTIYLSDLYTELLFTGLKYLLAAYYELSESKQNKCESEFNAAKTLIKRNNITQRMIQSGKIAGGYDDDYRDGLAGNGF